MYVLLVERRGEIKEALGWEVDSKTAVVEWSEEARVQSRPAVVRMLDAVVPQEPPSGDWRESQLAAGRQNRLFADYLIAFEGVDEDWAMLEQLIPMAQWDDDRLLGLHVVASRDQIDSPEVHAMKQRYDQRCQEAGLEGSLAVVAGNVIEQIVHHAAWADLVVLSLRHPPGERTLARLGNRLTHLIQRCPRPILTIPGGQHSPMNRILLAYDGSRKANEALFVATYLAGRWPVSLVVLTVETDYTPASALDAAREYIEARGIETAEFVLQTKPIAKAILKTAAEHDCNYLIMGGFGFQPVMHFMLGSTVDIMLRRFKHPILICR
jgi:nucleotide-binding universal stress UspA family protein